jgi:hypothetical protein
MATPLTKVIKKNVKFYWGADQENAFSIIKERLCSAPMLTLPDFNKNFEIECDVSVIESSMILSHLPFQSFFFISVGATK